MSHISPTIELKNQIRLLESRRAAEFNLLKAQFNLTVESLKPSNILKGAITETNGSHGILDKILDAAIGMITGFLTKKLLFSSSKNFFKQFLGILVQFWVTKLATKNSEFIKEAGRNFIKRNFSSNNYEKEKSRS